MRLKGKKEEEGNGRPEDEMEYLSVSTDKGK
jgi:hypothetical protein